MCKKVIAIAVAILVFGALVPNLRAQTSLLHEDFEGSFPPTGWTTVTESGSNQWYRNDYHGYPDNTSGGGGYCACNNDDYFGYVYIRNNSLESPAFDASGETSVWLAFNYTFQDWDGTEHAYVDVFDGGAWVQIKELSNTGTSTGIRDSTDISASVAGVANAQVRFRYDEDGGSGWAFWYLVDKVDVWAGGGGGPECETVLAEDFNGAWSTTSPPPGWTINYTGSVGNSDWHPTSRGGSQCASISWSPSETGVDELISPVIDCSAYGEVYLAMDHYYDHYSGSYTAQWLGSTDGGSSWPHVIWDYAGSDYGSYPFTRDSLDISFWAAGESQVAINVRGDGYTWNMNYWYVDNIVMTGCGGGGPGAELDLEVIQIIRPRDEEEGGVAFTPAIRVLNNLDTATALVGCRMKDFETRETVYEDVLASVPLVLGYNVVDGFKDFTPESNNKYTVLFWLEHPDDVDQSNNAKDKNWTTFAGTQVDATEILAPADEQHGSFAPQANFKEMLGEEGSGAADIMLRCKIEDVALQAVVYQDSIGPEEFEPDETKSPFFTEPDLTAGSYTITFWATYKDAPVGDAASKAFDYIEGIAETKIGDIFSLDVTGTKVNFSVAKTTDVTLRVYDVAGKLVTTLASGTHSAGSYSVNLNTKGITPGIYFVKMLTPEFSASGKMVVLY